MVRYYETKYKDISIYAYLIAPLVFHNKDTTPDDNKARKYGQQIDRPCPVFMLVQFLCQTVFSVVCE